MSFYYATQTCISSFEFLTVAIITGVLTEIIIKLRKNLKNFWGNYAVFIIRNNIEELIFPMQNKDFLLVNF